MRTRPAVTPPKGVTAKTPAVVLAIGAVAALVYGAKSVHEYFKNLWPRKAEESQVPIPDPPKVEAVINCVNSVGKPKEPLVPDMVYERSISVIAGRPNGGKTLLAQQLAIELARGDGELVGEDIPPQNVIIVDGEMDDDDYKRRFGGEDMVVPSNITRISDCDFSTLKRLTSYLKKLVDGLLGPAVTSSSVFPGKRVPLDYLKFHQLQILKGTPMASEYKERPGDFSATMSLSGGSPSGWRKWRLRLGAPSNNILRIRTRCSPRGCGQ